MKKRFEGREFDYLFSPQTNIILWGAANIGMRFLDFYAKNLNIVKVCDGNKERIGSETHGFIIEDPATITHSPNTVVIVTNSFYTDIKPLLKAKGFVCKVDFFWYTDFETIYRLYFHGRLQSQRVDISLTEKCTLNCRDCNMWMPHFAHPKAQPVTDVLHDIDLYFNTVDFVKEMELLGGEPLLYNELPKVIRYVREVYDQRVDRLVVFTNGTMLPSPELVALMKEWNVSVMLSDYTAQVDYQKRYDEVADILDANNIFHFAPAMEEWSDFGFPDNPPANQDDASAMERFDCCCPPFRGLYHGEVFFCHLETSAMRAGIFPYYKQDAFSLTDENPNRKERFLEFDLGFLPQGFIEFCRVCRGCGTAVNDLVVPFGQQMKRKNNGAK